MRRLCREATRGPVHFVPGLVARWARNLPGEIPRRKCRGKSAEIVVVADKSGAQCPVKLETDQGSGTKDRTEGSLLTATGMDADAKTADRRQSVPKRPDAASAVGTIARIPSAVDGCSGSGKRAVYGSDGVPA